MASTKPTDRPEWERLIRAMCSAHEFCPSADKAVAAVQRALDETRIDERRKCMAEAAEERAAAAEARARDEFKRGFNAALDSMAGSDEEGR